MHVYLETERLILRPFTEADIDNLTELDSDPEVMRYLTGGKPRPRHVVETEILPRFQKGGYWAAIEKATGRFLGWFELHPHDPTHPENVELGYRLRKEAWGKGFATEGARALIHKGFTELGVKRIFATTMAVNTASRRVMEKVGLTYLRTFHAAWPDPIPGAEHGDVEYALCAPPPGVES